MYKMIKLECRCPIKNPTAASSVLRNLTPPKNLRLRNPGGNHLFLEKNNIFSAIAFVLFVRFYATRLPAHISLAFNYFPNKILF